MRGGELFKMARQRAGLSQRELAERLGCRQASIARWERGDRAVAVEDVQAAAHICGLQLRTRLAREDRSWWPQIASQLELDPLDRVARLVPPGTSAPTHTLAVLAAAKPPLVVIGEIAGALQGWPLTIADPTVEVCAADAQLSPVLLEHGGSQVNGGYQLAGGQRVQIRERPPGTHAVADLSRGADRLPIGSDELPVASVLDLLRIADASSQPGAERQALAYQALLDVHRARASARVGDHSDEERIRAWLSARAPAA